MGVLVKHIYKGICGIIYLIQADSPKHIFKFNNKKSPNNILIFASVPCEEALQTHIVIPNAILNQRFHRVHLLTHTHTSYACPTHNKVTSAHRI